MRARSASRRLVRSEFELSTSGFAGVISVCNNPGKLFRPSATLLGRLLTTEDHGKNFYWPAIAGSWKAHIGGGTPRDFGPCGDVLDRNATLLFTHVERRYTYFQPVTPLVEEALLVPFYVEAKAVGTIWATAHDENRKFDAEDERIMGSLGKFASSAYQILASLDALKAEGDERQKAERASSLLAAIVGSSDDAIISKSLAGTICAARPREVSRHQRRHLRRRAGGFGIRHRWAGRYVPSHGNPRGSVENDGRDRRSTCRHARHNRADTCPETTKAK